MISLKHFSLLALLFTLASSFSPYRKNPAGTSNIPGLTNTFLDKTEITNISWKEYVWDVKETYGEESEEYQQSLPDAAVWEMSYQGDFATNQDYYEYPVVGVSYTQAVAYCKWRSERVSEREHREIEYSLPTLKAYKMVTRGETENKIAEGLYSTEFGFRTFSGICENAAEMTAEEGMAIAGSDRKTCLELKEYSAPTPTLGFRCIAVLK